MSILIFGSGYMGSAIAAECQQRGLAWAKGQRGNSTVIQAQIQEYQPDVLINACAFIPTPSVEACKDHPEETILGNVVWPMALMKAAKENDLPLVHLSTGCLYDEQREYTEDDPPTRNWNGYCGFYVGTKRLAEKIVQEHVRHYILRLRLPFDEVDQPRNYLTKLLHFPTVFDHQNSLTHRGDFAKAVLDLLKLNAPFGTYHVVNPGNISARSIIMAMMNRKILGRYPNIEESKVTTGALLSTKKLNDAGVVMRPVGYAVDNALDNWKPCITR